MYKQLSFVIAAVILLTAFVTVALYTGSETAQAQGNMTNATAAAGANMTNATAAAGANMTNATAAAGANMTQPLVPAQGPK